MIQNHKTTKTLGPRTMKVYLSGGLGMPGEDGIYLCLTLCCCELLLHKENWIELD